jgi:uncharacterized protein YndB with AHSA1/START domain
MKSTPFVIEQVYAAPVKKIWQALTNKEQMKAWNFDVSDFKAEVGFEFHFEGGAEDRSYTHLCKITEVVPERKLSYTWSYKGYPGMSTVTFELFPEGDKTRLRLSHAGLETFPVATNPDFAKKNFEMGWNEITSKSLRTYVETK